MIEDTLYMMKLSKVEMRSLLHKCARGGKNICLHKGLKNVLGSSIL